MCNRCGEEKPATTEYFRLQKLGRFGVHGTCKKCLCRSKTRAGVPDGYKRCTACKEIKPRTRDFFISEPKNSDGVGGRCKPCHAERQKKLRETEPEKYKQVQKEFSARNPDANKQYHKKKRIMQPEKMRRQSRAAQRRWQECNPERYRLTRQVKQLRRRARERAAEGHFTAKDIKSIFETQGGKCFWCQENIASGYHIDHFIPVSKGGSNHPENLVCSCAPCNLSKNAKMPWEFAPDRFSPPA